MGVTAVGPGERRGAGDRQASGARHPSPCCVSRNRYRRGVFCVRGGCTLRGHPEEGARRSSRERARTLEDGPADFQYLRNKYGHAVSCERCALGTTGSSTSSTSSRRNKSAGAHQGETKRVSRPRARSATRRGDIKSGPRGPPPPHPLRDSRLRGGRWPLCSVMGAVATENLGLSVCSDTGGSFVGVGIAQSILANYRRGVRRGVRAQGPPAQARRARDRFVVKHPQPGFAGRGPSRRSS